MDSGVIILFDDDSKLAASAPNSNSNKKSILSNRELPEEIVNEEILARLPVETLLPLRRVCKLWESLFFTPDFVQAHHSKSSSNKNSTYQDCLIAQEDEAFIILSHYKETRIEPPRPELIGAGSNLHLVGSINGLVCLVNKNEFFLWNPIIGRYRDFSIPQDHVPDHKGYWRINTRLIGFCWDLVENDYQVLVCYLSDLSMQGFIYSSKSNSWTKLVLPKFVSRLIIPEPISQKEYTTPCTIVKECPYWSRYYSSGLGKRTGMISLAKFEVQTQKFRSLPDINYNIVRRYNYNFVNVKDCLAIMVYRSRSWSPSTTVGVYILHEKSGVWNEVCTIGSAESELNIWSVLQGFKFGDEIVLQGRDKVFCYDPTSDEIKGFEGSSNHRHVLKCFSYTASLVFLEGMKRVQSRTIEEVLV